MTSTLEEIKSAKEGLKRTLQILDDFYRGIKNCGVKHIYEQPRTSVNESRSLNVTTTPMKPLSVNEIHLINLCSHWDSHEKRIGLLANNRNEKFPKIQCMRLIRHCLIHHHGRIDKYLADTKYGAEAQKIPREIYFDAQGELMLSDNLLEEFIKEIERAIEV